MGHCDSSSDEIVCESLAKARVLTLTDRKVEVATRRHFETIRATACLAKDIFIYFLLPIVKMQNLANVEHLFECARCKQRCGDRRLLEQERLGLTHAKVLWDGWRSVIPEHQRRRHDRHG